MGLHNMSQDELLFRRRLFSPFISLHLAGIGAIFLEMPTSVGGEVVCAFLNGAFFQFDVPCRWQEQEIVCGPENAACAH